MKGQSYALFGPTGVSWDSVSSTEWVARLPAGKGFLAVAGLPDDSAQTLALLHKHAYAAVTDTRVDWRVDRDSGEVQTTFTATTQMLEGSDVSALLGLSSGAEYDISNRPSTHELEGEEQHDHDDFISFSLNLPGDLSKDALLKRIETVIAQSTILRVKGFANIEGSQSRLLIQAVGPRMNSYFDRPWRNDEPRETKLVVIGVKGMDQAAITAALRG